MRAQYLLSAHTLAYINTADWQPRWEHALGDRNNRPLQSARTAETQWHHTKYRNSLNVSSLSPSPIHGRPADASLRTTEATKSRAVGQRAGLAGAAGDGLACGECRLKFT